MEERYDTIIVGAGPAGGTAAYFLAQSGHKVLVLEKEKIPRYKTCGGGISVRFLEGIFPFSFEPTIQSDVRKFSYAFLGSTVTVSVEEGIIGMVMREQFDAHLLTHVRGEIRHGVAVHDVIETDDRVIVTTKDGEQFQSRYLIGADGANSIVARRLGLRQKRRLAAGIEAEVAVPPKVLKRFAGRPLFIFGQIRLGYLWIFPKSEHLSVGIAGVNPRRGELQKTLRKVMSQYGISLDNARYHGHPIPLYTKNEKIMTSRVLLAGDAAGLVDPLSGEGIRYAIKSGRLAAQAILSGHAARYPRLVFRKIGWNHTIARVVSQVFYNLQFLCLALGAPNPFTTRAIVDLLSDRINTAGVMLRSILTLPVFIMTEVFAALAGWLIDPRSRDRIRSWVYGAEYAGVR